ncbi:hypothetical protein PsorP6_007231 [Peronosclerospora sorghi]|uniref:Uncharacterized protein n=1 Tax=Peronosclerospora sorghi TaxID=230839 RepID=A0ACC0W8G9_9STRA|nr:hypothetical protein PsorP6_007231 [Peronosclerospora sorghi]
MSSISRWRTDRGTLQELTSVCEEQRVDWIKGTSKAVTLEMYSPLKQVKTFGMRFNRDGSLVYGFQLKDKTRLRNPLSVLETLYLGESFQRNKYDCLLREQPKVRAQAYPHRSMIGSQCNRPSTCDLHTTSYD